MRCRAKVTVVEVSAPRICGIKRPVKRLLIVLKHLWGTQVFFIAAENKVDLVVRFPLLLQEMCNAIHIGIFTGRNA